jgi:hypothetical protein
MDLEATKADALFSTRDVADRYNVPLANVVKIVDRLGVGQRVARNRIVRGEDLGPIETGLIAAGYLKRPQSEAAHA